MGRKIITLACAAVALGCMSAPVAVKAKTPKLYVIAKADKTGIYVYKKTVYSTKFVRNADEVLFGYGGLRRIPAAKNSKFFTGDSGKEVIKVYNSKPFRTYIESVQYSPGKFKLGGKKIKMHMGQTSEIKFSKGKVKYIYDMLM